LREFLTRIFCADFLCATTRLMAGATHDDDGRSMAGAPAKTVRLCPRLGFVRILAVADVTAQRHAARSFSTDDMNETDLQYEIVGDEDTFRALQREWDDLWARAHGRYYQAFSVCWLAWLHVAKPRGRKLRCIVCRRNGQLVMAWPLVTHRRLLWTYVVPLSPDAGDYTSVLVESGPGASTLVAGAWHAARHRCGADFIHLPYMNEGLELYNLASRERHVLHATQHDSWIVKLREEDDWDAYCNSLGTMYSKKPGALERKLSKEGRVEVLMIDRSDASGIASTVDWMLECKRAWCDRVGKRGEWSDSPHFRNFLVDLLGPAEGEAMACLVVVKLDDKPIAAIVVSQGNPCANALIAGFDPAYGKFGPGSIAVEHCVKWAFQQGFDLDFGVGSERFKSYWSRDNLSTAWTLQIVNTPWGLLGVHGNRMARELVKRVQQLRHVPSTQESVSH
jgi:CelD/BcsL family acetyltransferase involved in cellulose biosynthesis